MSKPFNPKSDQEWHVDIAGSRSIRDMVKRSAERRKKTLIADISTNRRLRPYGRRENDNPNRSAW